jgi:hypothetical protein
MASDRYIGSDGAERKITTEITCATIPISPLNPMTKNPRLLTTNGQLEERQVERYVILPSNQRPGATG